MLQQYQNNGFKTLVINDYDCKIEQLIKYFRDVRIKGWLENWSREWEWGMGSEYRLFFLGHPMTFFRTE